MYIKWCMLFILDLIATIVNFPLSLFVVLFASEDGWLPKWLSWFQTPDNSLDGDGGWQNEHWQWRFKLTPTLARYVGRVGWLWRNSGYGFAIDVLGAKTLPTDELVITGDIKTGNRPIHNGTCSRVLYRDGKPIYWQYYYVKQWTDAKCIRINLGWKLWSFKSGENNNCQFVCSPNPMMGLSA